MNRLLLANIPRRQLVCSKGGERLQGDIDCYSLLLEEGAQNIVRRDFCAVCWFAENITAHKVLVHWKVRLPPISIVPTERPQRALNLWKKYVRSTPMPEPEAYVLALYLCRMRYLALRREFEQEGVMWGLYEVLESGEVFTIKQVPLAALEVHQLQATLATHLHTHSEA